MVQTLPEPSQGMTLTQMGVQRFSLLLTKAALSSIPFAALVFDIGQTAIDLANARVADRYLQELGRRIETLDEDLKSRLKTDPLHQIAGQGCWRSLLEESNERIATALARAVAELAQLQAVEAQRAECARILSALDEPMLHGLQTYYRFELNCLTDDEKAVAGHMPADQRDSQRNHLGLLLIHGLPLLSWPSVIERLMQTGLIRHDINGGVQGEMPEAVTVAPVTELGRRILMLCFDDPSRAAFGQLAL